MYKLKFNIYYCFFTAFILYLYIFTACGNSSDDNIETVTFVEFNNLEQFQVTIYGDSTRQTIFTEIEANGTKKIPTAPNISGVVFYPTFNIDVPLIPEITIPYNGPPIITVIEENITTQIPIPKLESITINTAYIKLVNDSNYSLSLLEGYFEKIPLKNRPSIITPGQSAAYEITSGSSSGYSVMKNTTTQIAFPENLTHFTTGMVYEIAYDGTNLVLEAIESIINPIYDGFYNYPTGMADQNDGRLTIINAIDSEVLLFQGIVDKHNYIGTISSLGSVRIKMPEKRFYTIVAVQKLNYEERRNQAAQFYSFAYYSDTQISTISVSPSSEWGAGNWVINNNSTFWVQVRKTGFSQNYAIIGPQAQRVTVPISIDDIYDYSLYFLIELRYNGMGLALVKLDDQKQFDNTELVTSANSSFTTTINNEAFYSFSIKPSVLIRNNSNKSVRVFYFGTQKTNGVPSNDFVIAGGQWQIVSGFETWDYTSNIRFKADEWTENKQVPASQSMAMRPNMIYEITIPNNEDASYITVTEVDYSKYFTIGSY